MTQKKFNKFKLPFRTVLTGKFLMYSYSIGLEHMGFLTCCC